MKRIISISALIAAMLMISSCSKHDTEIDDSLRTPVVAGYTPLSSTVAGLEPGTEITVTGNSLDKVVKVTIGETEAAITHDGYQTLYFSVPEGPYNYTIPSETYQGTRYQDTLRIYGPDLATMVYQKVFYIDIPDDDYDAGVLEDEDEDEDEDPIVATLSFDDRAGSLDYEDAPYGAYLGGKVTLSGSRLLEVETLTLDGRALSFTTSTADQTISFVVPDDFNNLEATDYDLLASGSFGTDVNIGSLTIYPFYHWTSITIGSSGESNRSRFAFLPEQVRVISTNEWLSEPVDKFALEHEQSTDTYVGTGMSSSNTLNKDNISEAQYYATTPYFFYYVTSEGLPRLHSPAGANAILKNFKTSAGDQMIAGGPGTPIIYYESLDSDNELSQRALAAAITSQDNFSHAAATASPAYGTWGVGSVIAIQYISYEAGGLTDLSGVHKTGFLFIKDITDIDSSGVATSESTITFDILWPSYDRLAEAQ